VLSIREIFKHSSKLSVSNLAGGALIIFANIVVARRLGPEGLGVVGLVQLWLLYASFIQPGIFYAGCREIPHLAGQGKAAEAERIEHITLSAEGLALLFPLSGMILASFFWYSDPVLKRALGIAAATMAVSAVFRWVDSIQWAHQRFTLTVRANMVLRIAQPLFLLSGVYTLGIYGVLAAPVCMNLLGLAFYAWSGTVRPRFVWDRAELRRLLAVGFPLALYNALYWGFRTSDRAMTAQWLSLTELGYFTFAMFFIQHGCQWVSDFLNVLQSNLFAELGKAGKVRPLSDKLQRISLLILLLSGGAAAAATSGFHFAAALLVPKFLPATPAFEILVLNLVCITAPLLGVAVLISAVVDRQKYLAVIQACGLGVNVGLGWVLVRSGWGLSGIAWSSVMANVPPRAGSMSTCRGVLYRLPGARFHCWPSPRSIGSFTVWPSARVNVS